MHLQLIQDFDKNIFRILCMHRIILNQKHSMHIDHQLGQLHEHQGYNILCAQPWINGQSAGKSWTSGKETREMWWQIKEDNILNNV